MALTRKLNRLFVKLATKAIRARDFALHRDPVDAVLAEVRSAGPEPELESRVVVITGSSEGIGLVLAEGFLQRGARVVLNGRRGDALRAAVAGLRPPERVHAVCADVSTPDGAASLLDEAVSRFGAVHLLINNAAVIGPKDVEAWETTPKAWSRTLDVNVGGPFLCATVFMRWMVRAGVSGRIINVSSGAANSPVKGLMPYAVSKSALDALTRGLAVEAEGTGISIIGIQLGSTRTRMARQFFPWSEYELLPPPETLLPVFWFAATAAPGLLHGRVIASWRFLMARDAEAHIAAPLSIAERFRFVEQKVPESVPAERRIVLNRAENPFGMPERVRALISDSARRAVDLSRYPDPDYGALRERLAIKHGVEAAGISFGNGSAELVDRVLRVFTRPGEAVVSNDPSWFMFDRFAYVHGVRNDKAPFVPSVAEGYDHNLDGVLAAVRGDTRLVYLISPSNPVGVPILHDPFVRFLERLPAHIPVVIDEAYVEFSDRRDMLDSARVVRESDRTVIVLRTFSKFYGLAGARVGYAFGSRQAIDWLDRGELLFNVSAFGAVAALAALDDTEHARRTFENCRSERRRAAHALAELGLDFVPTEGNLMLFEPPTLPDTFFDRLEHHGIVSARGVVLGRYVHWPISLPAHNDRFLEVIRSCL